jgi:two-component system response regulator WspF
MKVAIIHDDLSITRLFKHLLADLGHELIWTTKNGETALLKTSENLPDLILIQLPLADIPTVEVIKRIMTKQTTTIIVVGKSIKKQAAKVFEAMSVGALDAFSEPATSKPESIKELKNKITNIYKLHKSIGAKETSSISMQPSRLPLVAIGSSSGGPAALVKVLNKIEPDVHATFVIIQHIDKEFNHGMVKWINEQTRIKVKISRCLPVWLILPVQMTT